MEQPKPRKRAPTAPAPACYSSYTVELQCQSRSCREPSQTGRYFPPFDPVSTALFHLLLRLLYAVKNIFHLLPPSPSLSLSCSFQTRPSLFLVQIWRCLSSCGGLLWRGAALACYRRRTLAMGAATGRRPLAVSPPCGSTLCPAHLSPYASPAPQQHGHCGARSPARGRRRRQLQPSSSLLRRTGSATATTDRCCVGAGPAPHLVAAVPGHGAATAGAAGVGAPAVRPRLGCYAIPRVIPCSVWYPPLPLPPPCLSARGGSLSFAIDDFLCRWILRLRSTKP